MDLVTCRPDGASKSPHERKAQEKYPVQIHAAVAASNHYHLILTPADAEQLSDFMEYVNGNLAREAGRLIYWHEPPFRSDR